MGAAQCRRTDSQAICRLLCDETEDNGTTDKDWMPNSHRINRGKARILSRFVSARESRFIPKYSVSNTDVLLCGERNGDYFFFNVFQWKNRLRRIMRTCCITGFISPNKNGKRGTKTRRGGTKGGRWSGERLQESLHWVIISAFIETDNVKYNAWPQSPLI